MTQTKWDKEECSVYVNQIVSALAGRLDSGDETNLYADIVYALNTVQLNALNVGYQLGRADAVTKEIDAGNSVG